MIIKKLTLTNVRGHAYSEFEFKAGINLLVGINGVGKSTVLDALKICCSVIFPKVSHSKSTKLSFEKSDIRKGTSTLQVSCDFNFLDVDYNLLIVKDREGSITRQNKAGKLESISILDKEIFVPSVNMIFKTIGNIFTNPVPILFSTRRSLITEKSVSKTATLGGVEAAFVESLSSTRSFNIKTFAAWFNVQQKLKKEKPEIAKHVKVLQEALSLFLPTFSNLSVEEIDGELTFFVDKNGIPFNIYELSDGEKSLLCIVLDIAKRLSQANPLADDPLKEQAVILIDELDIHLHPKWQRTVIENLTRTFPNCQFIATTHSPQIIPSVEPEHIQIVGINGVTTPDRTLGMDANWILKYLMDTDERPENALAVISEVEELINDIEFDEAITKMNEYKKNGYDFPEWSILEARIAKLKILGEEADEADK